MKLLIGSDTGGTFTDFVAVENGRICTWKVASTPKDYAHGILEGVKFLSGNQQIRADNL